MGVALEGQQGLPIVVFNDVLSGDFLTVPVDPFDAEILIRDFSGEAESSAAAWLGSLLIGSPPVRGTLFIDDDNLPRIRIEFSSLRLNGSKKNRSLPLGEGLILIRRLALPLYADERLFDLSQEELAFLNAVRAFGGNFLYLTPPQFAPNIPLE